VLIGSLSNNWKTVISRVFYINVTITGNLFEISKIVFDMYNKLFSLSLVWQIQIHQHF